MSHKETSLTDQIGEILVDVLHQELEEVSITMLDEGIYQILSLIHISEPTRLL